MLMLMLDQIFMLLTMSIKDFGIIMSSNCSFVQHIIEVCKRCTGLCGLILRTFSSRESTVMMTLFKYLVLSRRDYGFQLWSPTKIHQIIIIEKIQKAFTKHIKGFSSFSYQERLSNLKTYSLPVEGVGPDLPRAS